MFCFGLLSSSLAFYSSMFFFFRAIWSEVLYVLSLHGEFRMQFLDGNDTYSTKKGILLEQAGCCRHLNNEIALWICQLRTLNIKKEMLICFARVPYLWTFGSSFFKRRTHSDSVLFKSKAFGLPPGMVETAGCGEICPSVAQPKQVWTTLPWHRQQAAAHLRELSPFPRGMWRTSAFPPSPGHVLCH